MCSTIRFVNRCSFGGLPLMRKAFRCVHAVALAAGLLALLALPLIPAGPGPGPGAFAAASYGPEIYDVRRGAAYGILGTFDSGCDFGPPQRLELEWDGGRIPWESLEITGGGDGDVR